MTSTFSDFYPIFIQIALALAVGVGIIVASHIFGQRSKTNAAKDSPYECGIAPMAKQHPRFGVKFYLVAMLFVIFDIEAVFIIPLAFIYRDFVANNLPIVLPAIFFMFLLSVGIVYEIKKGALDWNIPKSNR